MCRMCHNPTGDFGLPALYAIRRFAWNSIHAQMSKDGCFQRKKSDFIIEYDRSRSPCTKTKGESSHEQYQDRQQRPFQRMFSGVLEGVKNLGRVLHQCLTSSALFSVRWGTEDYWIHTVYVSNISTHVSMDMVLEMVFVEAAVGMSLVFHTISERVLLVTAMSTQPSQI